QAPAAALELPAVESITAPLGIAKSCGATDLLASQNRSDPRQEFPKAERLRYIVVGAKLEADDAIDLVSAVAGHNDNGNIRSGPDLPQKVETILVPQAQIEDDETWGCVDEVLVQFSPTGNGAGWHILF